MLRHFCLTWLIVVSALVAGCSATGPVTTTAFEKQPETDISFEIIPLGVYGGLEESNLSAYLVSTPASSNYLAFDAGTLLSGLKEAANQKAFSGSDTNPALSTAGTILRDHIKGYAISHPHIDHVSGLIINSTDDSAKPVYGLPETIEALKNHVFNWELWPNFANEGKGFKLSQYRYETMTASVPVSVAGTEWTLTAFPLSHSGANKSTAFLLRSGDDYLLYLGDTGPDDVENTHQLGDIWRHIAPLVRQQQLKGMLIEASYPSSRADNQLFGHLTPKWLCAELSKLAAMVNEASPDKALTGLNVIVTHMKPALTRQNPVETIKKELAAKNTLGVTIIIPQQGKTIFL